MILIEINTVQLVNSLQVVSDLSVKYMNIINKEVRNKIADRTPVRSGRAKRGWEGRYLGGNRIHSTVDNKVPYVPYLENGHSKQAPNGFMKQGIDAGMASAELIIKEIERLK